MPDEPINSDMWSGSRISMVRDPSGNIIIDAADAVLDARELSKVVMTLWVGAHTLIAVKPKPASPDSESSGGYA